VLPVVEDDLEHPAGVERLRGRQVTEEAGTAALAVQQRTPVTIPDAFEVLVDGATFVSGLPAVALAGPA
jgi:hypothetical protein